MSDPLDPDPMGDPSTQARRPTRSAPSSRRHLIVLGIAVAGIVIGATLVITGRTSPEQATSTTTATTQAALLPNLGAVADQAAAKTLMGDLDPKTLGPADPADPALPTTTGSSASPPNGVDLSEAGLQRCQQAIAQQSTDRSLGTRSAASRLLVDRKPTFVVSYELPASGSDRAGDRLVLVDARTCRVLAAIDP
ncbi:MAG TPA: hypothetical protein VFN21_13945 [Acidimicrobiales bacterium]|nr:hypothetical protein [Acidimicrobiales bacterium]